MNEKTKKIEKLVDFIKSSDFSTPGNSRGKAVYHEIPFEDFEDRVDVKRTNNKERLDLLLGNFDFKDKIVLDIGCNIGYFGFELSKLGAHYIGIDVDSDSIEVAKSLKDIYQIDNVEFYCSGYDRKTIKDILNKYKKIDFVFLLSVNHWIFQDIGISEFINISSLLLSDKQKIIYEASSASGAYYPKYLKKKEIFKLLSKIGYNKIEFLGDASANNLKSGNESRKIYQAEFNKDFLINDFISSKDKKIIKDRKDKKIYKFKNYLIKQVSRNYRFLLENEYEKLNILKFYDCFSIPLGIVERDNYFYLILRYIEGKSLVRYSLVPRRYRDVFKEAINNIVENLDREKIVHRDFRPENLMIHKKFKKVSLIDFEFAIFENKELNPDSVDEKKLFGQLLLKLGGKWNIRKYLYSIKLNDYSAKLVKGFYTNPQSFKKKLRIFLSFLKKKMINYLNLIKKMIKRYIFLKK